MSYTKVGWKDYPDTSTPLTASNLDAMDSGIKNNSDKIGDTDISDVANTITKAISQLNANDSTNYNSLLGKINNNYDTLNNKANSLGKALSANGTNVSILDSNGNVLSTVTTQDTNTWRGIQNNLTSDSTSDSLSAAMGKYLNEHKLEVAIFTNTDTYSFTATNHAYLIVASVGDYFCFGVGMRITSGYCYQIHIAGNVELKATANDEHGTVVLDRTYTWINIIPL